MTEKSRKGFAWTGIGGKARRCVPWSGAQLPRMPTAESWVGVPVWTGPQGGSKSLGGNAAENPPPPQGHVDETDGQLWSDLGAITRTRCPGTIRVLLPLRL